MTRAPSDSTSQGPPRGRPPIDHIAERCAVALRKHRGPIPRDLRGGCQVGSVLLSLALQHHRYRHRFEQAWVRRSNEGHVWIEARGQVLDITATQFGLPGLVHRKRLARRPFSATPGQTGRLLKGQRGYDQSLYWHKAPRRRYDVLVPALAEVLSVSRREARRRVEAFVGPEVRR